MSAGSTSRSSRFTTRRARRGRRGRHPDRHWPRSGPMHAGDELPGATRRRARSPLTWRAPDSGGSRMACSAAPGGAGAGNTSHGQRVRAVQVPDPVRERVLPRRVHDGRVGYRRGAWAMQRRRRWRPALSGAAPIADFSVTVTSGNSIFADPSASTPNSGVCNISGYTWGWGDGKSDVGTATGDPHTYGMAGTYSITLSVTNQGGSGTRTRNVTVPAGPPPPTCTVPTASFTFVKQGRSTASPTPRRSRIRSTARSPTGPGTSATACSATPRTRSTRTRATTTTP